MKKFVQPDPTTGYRFTSYQIKSEGPWPLTETGCIYHKTDLSDLAEPYLSAVKASLAVDNTPKETDELWYGEDGSKYEHFCVQPHEEGGVQYGEHLVVRTFPKPSLRDRIWNAWEDLKDLFLYGPWR